jgi:hypothetical protein
MTVESIESFEPVTLNLCWPAIAVIELVSIRSDAWAWKSVDGSWFIWSAARA